MKHVNKKSTQYKNPLLYLISFTNLAHCYLNKQLRQFSMQAIKKIFCSPQDATNLRLVWSRWKTFECKKHVLVIIKYQGQDPWTGALSQGSGGFHTLHDNEFLGSETSNLKVISLCLVLVCSRPDIFTFLFHMQLAKSLQHRNTWRTLKITERYYRRRRGEARCFFFFFSWVYKDLKSVHI